jgi:hypothetical protein
MMVYEKNTHSRTRSCHYMESFVLIKTFCPRIRGQNVVCIKCGSMLAETYSRIPDMYPAAGVMVTL